ncbi:DUF2589 domain-containing protein [Chitinibacter tainanensis]|uniref:DUF2589 domain-containing protein n=1 Tax=Chitinibacter tainanensis TaxID=230667 RepID=UPI0023546A2E|nr:DUF2589 domain-containing protein [Chitinibacter tainanensis]
MPTQPSPHTPPDRNTTPATEPLTPPLTLNVAEIKLDFDITLPETGGVGLGADFPFGPAVTWPDQRPQPGSIASGLQGSAPRRPDQSAKYAVVVRSETAGVPEGLARVLDILAANIAPAQPKKGD